jgi:hypothetical protein|tara:strand:+ start:1585 stop:2724 length:1140 start_codon:yes stop_codon:yes gene_type:complete
MAVYKIFPEKDTTLYSMFPIMNTGIDEIVEATLTSIAPFDPNPQVSRFVTKFADIDINNVFTNIIPTGSLWQANLRCFSAKTEGLLIDTTLDIFAVSQSWGMGTGRYLDDPLTTNGASWIFRTYSGSSDNKWDIQYGANSTGSYNLNYAPAGGGTWYIANPINQTTLSSSQVFTYASSKDLNTNVTPIVNLWVSSSTYDIPNDGFLIKQRLEFQANDNIQPEIKFFSVDTHTIYPPQLEIKWDDFTYVTGSLTVLNTLPATITTAQNPGIFYTSSINQFRINARPEYPVRVWQTASLYTTNYALPTASYWALKDLDTNEYVIDFDPIYTKLSCDASGSYFTLHMNGLQPERYYQILIQTEVNGSTIVFDDKTYFKVING